MNVLLSATSFNYFGIVVGVAIALSSGLAFFWALKVKKLYKDIAFDLVIATIIPAILGARIYYVLFTNLKTPNAMSFADFFNPQIGSFSFYGALIFGLLGILVLRFLVRRGKQYATLPQILDYVSPFLVLGQSICAFFSFINNMSYGQKLAGDKYYIIGYYVQHGVDGAGYYQSTFLLEGLICLLAFSVLIYIYLNTRYYFYNGFCATVYAIIYGAGRLFVESLKNNALYIVPPEGNLEGFKASSFFSIILLVVGIVAFATYLLLATKNKKRLLIFTPISKYRPKLFYGSITMQEPVEGSVGASIEAGKGREKTHSAHNTSKEKIGNNNNKGNYDGFED